MTPVKISQYADDNARPGTSLRIAHVTATFPPYIGGTGTVAFHNALELAKLDHQVHVFTVGPAQAEQSPPDVEVHRLEAQFGIGNAPFAPRLARGLLDFDLVHLHYPFYFGAEQIWWAHLRNGLPYVITYHQDVILRGPSSLPERLHHRLLGRRILAGARFVAGTSMDYVEHSRLTCLAKDRLVEVPNGVDLDRFHPRVEGAALRARRGISPSSPVVLLVATLDRAHYFKGVDVLLTAMRVLPDATLLVVGDGELRSVYEGHARAAGLGSQVSFLGYVPAGELPAYFALADVVAVPSTTRGEAFSLVAVEAMAAGKPVVASRLPGLRSVVEDGRTGLLSDPGDAAGLAAKLRMIISDPELARRMGRAGRSKAEMQYDWRQIALRLESLYFNALGR